MAPAREVDVLQRVHAAIVLGDPDHLEERRIGAASIRHGDVPKGGFARALRANRPSSLYSSAAVSARTSWAVRAVPQAANPHPRLIVSGRSGK